MESNSKIAELGKCKENISKALFQNSDIRELILGDTTGMSASALRNAFKNHVKSHLFIDGTISETESYIFYDVRMPYIGTTTKRCEILMYVICHRDILEGYVKEGYYGNRADILCQMVESTLVGNEDIANLFGIGKLRLEGIDIYNTNKLYGHILTFNMSSFR